jgi:DNA-binding response OmpR family regulator
MFALVERNNWPHSHGGELMMCTNPRLDSLTVVDANSHDYGDLCAELGRHGVHVRVYATGEEALRGADACVPTVWVINARLPDMSGITFLSLVRRRARRCSVFLVSDEYSAADELEARSAGATGYLCKPASAAWLEGCRQQNRSSSIRAGPAPFS